MLLIFYGGTSEMGKKSRDYLQSKGYTLIEKLNYVPEDHILKTRYEPRKTATREAVEAEGNYVYSHGDGMKIGFNKAQVLSAVKGQANCLLPLSTDNVDFIDEMKATYQDFVTVVGVYAETGRLEKMFRSMAQMDETELAMRIQIGNDIKKNILEKRHLFDDIVIYEGEDAVFNTDALLRQLDEVLQRAEKREKIMRDKTYVELPYKGHEPYVFISYSHKDFPRIKSTLYWLQHAGYRVWYDDGLRGGDNWRQTVASKIENENCKDFLLFTSHNSVTSEEIYGEILAAKACKKRIIPIQMDKDSKFPLHLDMHLMSIHHLFFDEDLRENLQRALDEEVRNH